MRARDATRPAPHSQLEGEASPRGPRFGVPEPTVLGKGVETVRLSLQLGNLALRITVSLPRALRGSREKGVVPAGGTSVRLCDVTR